MLLVLCTDDSVNASDHQLTGWLHHKQPGDLMHSLHTVFSVQLPPSTTCWLEQICTPVYKVFMAIIKGI